MYICMYIYIYIYIYIHTVYIHVSTYILPNIMTSYLWNSDNGQSYSRFAWPFKSIVSIICSNVLKKICKLNTVLVVDSMLCHFAGNAGEESIIM